jgi:hypothetical protein
MFQSSSLLSETSQYNSFCLGSFYLPKIPPADDNLVGNAKIAGLADDLHLHGLQYNIALTVFFVPYALFEVPSNIVLKLLRPSIWISILMFSWGLVMTLMGVIQNTKGLYAARFFLGFAEVCALSMPSLLSSAVIIFNT